MFGAAGQGASVNLGGIKYQGQEKVEIVRGGVEVDGVFKPHPPSAGQESLATAKSAEKSKTQETKSKG